MALSLDHLSPAERRRRIIRSDLLLTTLAVVGVMFYVWQYPNQDTEAAMQYPGEPSLVEAAQQFLEQNGYDTFGLESEIGVRRRAEWMDALQQAQGRTEAIRLLKGETASLTPVYYWRIAWSGEDRNGDDELRYIVRLTHEGQVFSFENQFPGETFGQPNLAAMRQMLRQQVEIPEVDVAVVPDPPRPPLGREGFFIRNDSLASVLDSLMMTLRDSMGLSSPPLSRSRRGGRSRTVLDSTAALSLIRYHVAQTPLRAAQLQVDSLWFLQRGRLATINARLMGAEPVNGLVPQVDVEVSPLGMLLGLESDFEMQTEGSEGQELYIEGDEDDGEDSVGVRFSMGVSLTIYTLLVITFIFVFFRRFGARTIDSSAALRDAAVFGLIYGVSIFMITFPAIARDTQEVWMPYVFGGVAAIIVGIGVGTLTFMISGVTDSMAREVWPKRLRTLSLLRHGGLRTKPVGRALLRGVALTGVLLGLFTLLLWAVPNFRLGSSDIYLTHDRFLSPFGAILGDAVWDGFMMLTMVLLGVGTFIYRRFNRGWPVVVIGTLLIGLMLVSPSLVQPFEAGLVSSALFGVAYALVFWRYDLLSSLVAFVLTQLIWMTGPGWAVPESPLFLDFALALATVGSVAMVGFVGVSSGKSGEQLPQYVPDYIVELGKQERLTRELEIARQVQYSFLPQRMPQVKGVDIAGMCLAAQEVGGDYYDFVQLDDHRLAVIIGDVSGKGIQAAFYMTLAKGFFRTLCREIDSPAEVLTRMNRLFWENAERGTFISVIYGIVDLKERTFTFSRAGHNPVILKRSPSQEPNLMQPGGLALGLVPDDRFERTIEERSLNLRTGDVLVFYTDGFSEAMNNAKQMYGDDRLARKVAEVGKFDAENILRVISEDVHRFVEQAGRHDDMTMVVLKIGPALTDGVQHAQVSRERSVPQVF